MFVSDLLQCAGQHHTFLLSVLSVHLQSDVQEVGSEDLQPKVIYTQSCGAERECTNRLCRLHTPAAARRTASVRAGPTASLAFVIWFDILPLETRHTIDTLVISLLCSPTVKQLWGELHKAKQLEYVGGKYKNESRKETQTNSGSGNTDGLVWSAREPTGSRTGENQFLENGYCSAYFGLSAEAPLGLRIIRGVTSGLRNIRCDPSAEYPFC
ncbi:hypothetical protein J6590_041907 [Homalodisca vitripennis]|nr:hypothetical protein J6590_041907 [Homalodisca vitripennis]